MLKYIVFEERYFSKARQINCDYIFGFLNIFIKGVKTKIRGLLTCLGYHSNHDMNIIVFCYFCQVLLDNGAGFIRKGRSVVY